MTQGYTCHCCNLYHDEIPLCYGSDVPIYVYSMSTEEREQRVEMNNDMCIIDDEHFFIRGNLIIPIIDSDEDFSWGIWATVSKANMENMVTNWEIPGRECIVEPAFGYLSTPIPVYEDTLNLHLLAHTMPVGSAPVFEVEPTSHPLSMDQRHGIIMARVHEIAKILMPS